MAEPPKPINITIVLSVDNNTRHIEKQVIGSLKIGEILSQKHYEFSCFNDGIRLVETNDLNFYGIGDGDIVDIKGLNKPVALARSSRVVPNEKDYHQIYLNSDKCGFLLKKKTSTVSGWKKRWVVLCRGFLFYYLNPKDDVPIGKLLINRDCVKFIGSSSDKQFVFNYENRGNMYMFACEDEEEYNMWKKCLIDYEPSPVSTVAMKMLQESTAFQKSFEFYIHETKVLTISSKLEFTFVHLNLHKSVYFSTQKEYEQWKKLLSDTIKIMGRDLYNDSFITDEYKDEANILKRRPGKKDKNVPFGCFDLLLARVEVFETSKGFPVLEIKTSEGEYHFTSSNMKELKIWSGLIQRECTGTPQNVQRLQHVTFDLEWDTSGSDPNEIFDLKNVLGTGSFGTVYRAVHRQSNFEMAIKILTVDKQKLMH
ncbi:non-specific serine/threonine protein kinase [Entamoeba marina]